MLPIDRDDAVVGEPARSLTELEKGPQGEQPQWLLGVVCAVSEADELILWAPAAKDLSRVELVPTRRIRLAGVLAPRSTGSLSAGPLSTAMDGNGSARQGKLVELAVKEADHQQGGEEPWAFEARDWVRHRIAGCCVRFSVSYQVRGEDFAMVLLDTGELLQRQLVGAGFARVVRNSPDMGCALKPLRDPLDGSEKSGSSSATTSQEDRPSRVTSSPGPNPNGTKRLTDSNGCSSEFYAALILDEEEAKRQRRGLWSAEEPRRHQRVPIRKLEAWLATKFPAPKQETAQGVVERVVSGSLVLLRVPEESTDRAKASTPLVQRYDLVPSWLAGIACPFIPPIPLGDKEKSLSSASTATATATVQVALQARFLTERYLLQRDVVILGHGQTPEGHWLVSIDAVPAKRQVSVATEESLHARLGEALLTAGLARITDWGMDPVKACLPCWRRAEAQARTLERGLWKLAAAKEPAAVPSQTTSMQRGARFRGHVMEILSGDTLIMRREEATSLTDVSSGTLPGLQTDLVEKGFRVGLAYLRAFPRETEGAYRAREWLRTCLIGTTKPVLVQVEYRRPAGTKLVPSRDGELPCVLLWLGQTLVNVALLEAGLVQLQVPREINAEASLSETLALFQAAQKEWKQRQVMAEKSGFSMTQTRRVHDLTQRDATRRARELFPILCRGQNPLTASSELTGIVEHVSAGTRFKVFLTKDALLVSFALAGVRCSPWSPARQPTVPTDDNDAIGKQAWSLARMLTLQRDVCIRLLSMDRHGTFLGTMCVLPPPMTEGHRQNLVFQGDVAECIVRQGLATLLKQAELPAADWQRLERAQREAQREQLGLWAAARLTPSLTKHLDDSLNVANQGMPRRWQSVEAVEILPGGRVFFRPPGTAFVDPSLIRDLARKVAAQSSLQPWTPDVVQPSDWVVAHVPWDDHWYRARVLSIMPGERQPFLVRLVDYGNEEWMDASSIRPIPFTDTCGRELVTPPAQALAFRFKDIMVPETGEPCWEESGLLLRQLIWGRPLDVVVTEQDPGPAPESAPELGVFFGDLIISRPAMKESETLAALPETSVARILVQRGLAWCLHQRDDLTGSVQAHRFATEELQARQKRVGIWQQSDALRFASADEPILS
jgi:endonuclease YncB( thermonuclease family)